MIIRTKYSTEETTKKNKIRSVYVEFFMNSIVNY